MSVRPLPSSTPAAQGVDASGVLAFLDDLETTPDIEPHSLMILRHGRLVASGWWAPYAEDRPHLLYSISKSFTSTAVGIAAGEGLIRLDDPVISYFPEFEAEITDPRSRAMLVRHVASMASGHETDTLFEARERDREDLVRGFLLVPPPHDPGTVFAYNQSATFALSAIIQRVSGQSLTEYLRPRLLDPLGIGDVAWLTDRSGRELGFSGLHATTDAIARLGQLYLSGGVWEGERLLPEWWVAEATRPQIPNAGAMPGEDWQRGYGFKFWMSRHGYRGDGAFGQFCIVLPEQDVVIATTADTWDMQTLLNMVWEHLLPAFRAAPVTGGEEADAALAERLAGLALQPAVGKPAPPERAEAWSAAAFTPDGGVCGHLPKLTAIDLAPGADGWTLTLTEDGHPLPVRFGEAGWTVTEEPVPTAVSGGWTGTDTLAVDVAFLETPHHLDVTCSLKDRTFKASWRTDPLHSLPLRAMRAPRGPR
ncbi:serine hydrolase domain-containing protein [Streptomyces sp. HD]|uniref:serine hydrolase domain-containing protein n=1 Tax=Streptomyces sp. HD TaxID=3020892 RepID=UPI00232D6BF7|nr:serine hydrolase domain-containing protein [Streptomyces sp. HD]MDC0769810.1 serine hydrolase [Streptomyces sp. HD]